MKITSKELKIFRPKSEICKEKSTKNNHSTMGWKPVQRWEFKNLMANWMKPFWIWEEQLIPLTKADKKIEPIFRNTKTIETKAKKKKLDFQKESVKFKSYLTTNGKDRNL